MKLRNKIIIGFLFMSFISGIINLYLTNNSDKPEDTIKNPPILLWKERAYGRILKVAISPNGEYIAVQVWTGFGKEELQLYKEQNLLWKQERSRGSIYSTLLGFTPDSNYVLVAESGLVGYGSLEKLYILNLKGELEKEITITSPGGGIYGTGGTIVGTNYSLGSVGIAYSDNGGYAIVDDGISDFHDKGICKFDKDGNLSWRFTLEYPEKFDDVWVSHSGKLVLAKTDFRCGPIEYYLLDEKGKFISKISNDKLKNLVGEYSHTSDIAFSLDDALILFYYKGKMVFFDNAFNKIQEISQEHEHLYKTKSVDFYTINNDIICCQRHYKEDYDWIFILLQPDGNIRWKWEIPKGETGLSIENIDTDMTPDGKYVVIGSTDTFIYKWKFE